MQSCVCKKQSVFCVACVQMFSVQAGKLTMTIDKTDASSLSVKRHVPVVALAGNPNSGKTTIFNKITGERRHVGNYAGVTVDTFEGVFSHAGHKIKVVDLPGAYSLTACSAEELVARKFITERDPDLVVHIADASNLERNLYLTTQLMELNIPVLLVLNMSDIAKRRGYVIDVDILSQRLGLPVVETIATQPDGVTALKEALVKFTSADASPITPKPIHYGREVERELKALESLIPQNSALVEKYGIRWVALKLLENDGPVLEGIVEAGGNRDVIAAHLQTAEAGIRRTLGDSPEIIVADRRYGFISGACSEAVKSTVEFRHSVSDRIDIILTNEVAGIPVFLAMMYVTFKMIFSLGDPMMQWIEAGFSRLSAWISAIISPAYPMLASVLTDGVIGGVGGVLVFMPNILLLFLAIALLEDSGYMARAAFIMDRFMHKLGLHGKSFVPIVIGFGCTVPAIMATRMLETRRGRLTTMLVLPLISCGARLPIYGLFIPAFFPQAWRTPLFFALYVTGIGLAAIMAKLLRATILRGEAEPFVMELPPYRIPTIKGALAHTWERSWLFLRKVGTIILAASVILWVMTSFPKPPESLVQNHEPGKRSEMALSYSIAGRMGRAVEPVMKYAGFDWKASTALIGALAGKELFVAQLGILNAISEEGHETETLRIKLRRQYTSLQALSIMLFCLISVPCMATVAATWKESGSWKWAAGQFVGLTVLAYIVSFLVYQTGLLFLRFV